MSPDQEPLMKTWNYFVILLCLACKALAADVAVTSLRCECWTGPLGIEVTEPSLGEQMVNAYGRYTFVGNDLQSGEIRNFKSRK